MIATRWNPLGKSGKPYAYEVEYIRAERESYNVGSYIDTGIAPNSNYKVEVVANWYEGISSTALENPTLFGVRTSASYNMFEVLLSTYALRFQYGSSSISGGILQNVTSSYCLDKNKFYVDGNLRGTAGVGTFENTHTLTVCALNNNGNVSRFITGNIYSIKIWDDTGLLVQDAIPVVDFDGVVRVYDKISNSFLPQFGEFIAGERI